MRRDEELWMKKMREAFKDYSEPPAPEEWSRLEKELRPMAGRRIHPYTWWVAAAVILLAVSGISLFFIQSPTADDIRYTMPPALAVVPDDIPETKEPETLTPQIKSEKQPAGATKPYIHISEVRGTEKTAEAMPATKEVQDELPEAIKKDTDEDKDEVTQQPDGRPDDGRTVVRPSGRDKWHLPVTSGKKQSSNAKWSVAASFSNAAGASSAQTQDYLVMASSFVDGESLDMIPIKDGSQLVFKEGIPYLKQTVVISEMKHKQPVSFGLSVRKNLSNGFSVESGVIYTMLSSEGKSANSASQKVEQKLHYIGIPIRGNWNIADSKQFTLYLIAGGMIEKCIYGKIDSEKQTVKPLQFSLSGGIGGQLNVTNHIGLYVEPGVSYFFNDGSNIETIRKENPFNFNLQGGIRFTY